MLWGGDFCIVLGFYFVGFVGFLWISGFWGDVLVFSEYFFRLAGVVG